MNGKEKTDFECVLDTPHRCAVSQSGSQSVCQSVQLV